MATAIAHAQASATTTTTSQQTQAAILYNAIRWGNAVDFGVYWLPVATFKNIAACDATRHELYGADLEHMCREATTEDEFAIVTMLSRPLAHGDRPANAIKDK